MITKHKIIIGGAATILIVGGSLLTYSQSQDNKPDQPTPEVMREPLPAATAATEAQTEPAGDTIKPGSEPVSSGTHNPVISHLSQDGGLVRVRAFIDRADAAGTCTLTFEKSGYNSVQRSDSTILVTDYYACRGFDIAVSDFPARGEWSVYVTFTGDSKSGRSETKNISIN